jgi:hypothetical protein
MVAAENCASDCITQSVPPAGNIERQHGSSEKFGIETQHALYSLAQMRDFQTLNLKKEFLYAEEPGSGNAPVFPIIGTPNVENTHVFPFKN